MRDGGQELCQPQKDKLLAGQPSFRMPPAMESIPPQAGRQDLDLKRCRADFRGNMGALRTPDAGPQNVLDPSPPTCCPRVEPAPGTPGNLSRAPFLVAKEGRFPFTLLPGERLTGEAASPGKPPGHAAAGNSPLEGEATHPRLPPHRHGVPLTAGTPRGRGGGCEPGPSSPMGQGLGALSGPQDGGMAKGP